MLLVVLNQLELFFLSRGSTGGLIGSVLILGASYFVKTGLPLKQTKWWQKLLFVGMGYLLGSFIFYYPKIKADMLHCAILGSGWPYIAISFESLAKAISKGIKKQGKVAAKKALEMVIDSLEEEEEAIELERGRVDGPPTKV